MDVESLERKQLEALTSLQAMSVYKTTRITVDDLKILRPSQIEVLTSHNAHRAYELGIELDGLIGETEEIINCNIAIQLLKAFFSAPSQELCQEMKSLPGKEIESISELITDAYDDRGLLPSALKHVRLETAVI